MNKKISKIILQIIDKISIPTKRYGIQYCNCFVSHTPKEIWRYSKHELVDLFYINMYKAHVNDEIVILVFHNSFEN